MCVLQPTRCRNRWRNGSGFSATTAPPATIYSGRKLPAVKNRAHARLNPFAQMRDDELTFDLACTTSDIDLPIATPLKVSDCSQITDGAAAVVLCSKHFIEKVQPRGAARLIGFAHTTDYLSLKKGCLRFSDGSQSRRASLCDGWHRPGRH
jgi:hypothetical protein